ncbi:amidohydrolase family protein [Blastococcus sp. URHD0036]|uniref:amidohydrolase family protein n=1 Tax=Blastococcus sp. URHD0036 TaxID=1380356 RepID=UPI000A7BCBDE|nr:amidohydrolase family protein [Blastococcus sp. URHD0036]
MARRLDFPVFDADNHFYETTDAFTKYLPAEYAGLVKYVQVNGRTKIALRNVISEYIPNPTFNKVAPPGALELEFRAKNPSSKHKPVANKTSFGEVTNEERSSIAGMPPKYIESPPAFFNPADRLMVLDELGLDRAVMWPTLASLLEERMADDPDATHVMVHALNEWMHEHWTFNYENRIFPTPVITLPVLDKALAELDYVVERGAKAILIRPAPVPGYNGRRRSFALPEYDPFWERVNEAGLIVGMHSSDDGQQRYMNEWEGRQGEFLAFAKTSGFHALVSADYRGIKDTVTSIVGHGLATRFPDLRFMPVENGSSWLKPLLATMAKVYGRNPGAFDEDPTVALKRSIVLHPFFEEDVVGVIEAMGVDNVVFGSDYPHPEGLHDPIEYMNELEGLSDEDKAKVMGGNLNKLFGFAADDKVIAA